MKNPRVFRPGSVKRFVSAIIEVAEELASGLAIAHINRGIDNLL
ncbi:hypothetical protein [Roseofilum casamattae]|uniref:Uncharacterized protein n=1 Tax=Roseofilum casamattae BLCC-M143 TaxID=3022442 RepID=A0ABT7C2D8_9CYAN|nr:hypothetical protein [Roseofilum casamattae]MDJ1185623.1 hypothetical protein [Roseofilum casamattae BLCC-M143]